METNIDQSSGVIVKSDQTGRTRYTPQYKREVLAAFESSSLSAPVFARQCGIKYPTLAVSAQQSTSRIFARGLAAMASMQPDSRWCDWRPGGF